MPDITMCLNTTCPVKDYCWRSTAPPDTYQSVSYFGKCESEDYSWFWWDLRKKLSRTMKRDLHKLLMRLRDRSSK